MRLLRRLAACGILALGAGCATLEPPFDAHLRSGTGDVRGCAQWFRALDGAIEAAGVRDAQHARVPGFPYLRVDRLHAALRERAAASERGMHALAERLLQLDFESRRHELDNLPLTSAQALPGVAEEPGDPRAAALARTRSCGRLLRETDLARPAARSALLEAAAVPDDYSTASRVIGLYPLTRLAFAAGVRRWERDARAAFDARRDPQATRVRHAPPSAAPPLPRSAAAVLLGRAELEPLGVPLLQASELERFAAAYAPSFELAIGGDHDRFGALRWRRGAAVPEVDAAQAVTYVQQSHARYRGGDGTDRILLQLVYTIWFPERPPSSEHDILAGLLDGLVWRVTLAPDGEPLLYDSMHACGCYHQFFPTPRARPRPAPDALEEWAFVPLRLRRVAEGERPVVRIASGTHYIEGVELVRGADSVSRYAIRSYDELRSLARMEGGRRSAFGPDGLIAGTERPERFLFWPMGIRSAGAMRQWGRHATAFIGRRHFDDADLIEKRFELDLSGARP